MADSTDDLTDLDVLLDDADFVEGWLVERQGIQFLAAFPIRADEQDE